MQQTTSLKGRILEKLNEAKELVGDNQIFISRTLGYPKDIFSRVKSDANYQGSTQLLAGITLFCELETLKKQFEKIKQTKPTERIHGDLMEIIGDYRAFKCFIAEQRLAQQEPTMGRKMARLALAALAESVANEESVLGKRHQGTETPRQENRLDHTPKERDKRD